jgi:hypothetical protein
MNPAVSVNQVGDEIQFNATFYNTIIQAGTGIAVAGTGTALNPYIISLLPIESPWLRGDIKEVSCTAAYLAANFLPTGLNKGLGIGERIGWAICNGNNDTPNDKGRVVVGYGIEGAGTNYPNIDTLLAPVRGGYTDTVLLNHSHYVFSAETWDSPPNTGLGPTLPNQSAKVGGNWYNDDWRYLIEASNSLASVGKSSIEGTEASGTNRNMQPYVIRLKIMKL